jgi:hypothetical protein
VSFNGLMHTARAGLLRLLPLIFHPSRDGSGWWLRSSLLALTFSGAPVADPTPAISPQVAAVSVKENSWASPARFLAVWLFPAFLAFYLKWYMMADQLGFAREAQSMGLQSLNVIERISFFRGELFYGAFLIPLALLTLNRYLPVAWSVFLTGTISFATAILLGIQLMSLKEFGRFSSFKMIRVGLSWAWHEPGSNAQYLMSREGLLTLLALVGIACALAWAARESKIPTAQTATRAKTLVELYGFAVVAVLLLSIKSDVPRTPYQENSILRAASSLWKENAVETGEFGGLDMNRASGLVSADLSHLSDAALIARYREFARVPAPSQDPRYFGKEAGANVLFFILETTPEKYLPVGQDLARFPNFNRLQRNSFVGTRHYTTFPITRSALFSVFSSWYPIDDAENAFDSPAWDSPDGFLQRLNSMGYQTAVFSPLRAPGVPDAALFEAMGFRQQVYPQSAVTNYDQGQSWQQERMTADLDTLHLLETQLDQWIKQKRPFAAAFLPQIAHSPYPDGKDGQSAAELQDRGQIILEKEDAWLGELLTLLQKDGQLDNTIVVVVGDHGLRNLSENPEMRRGTVDETAFHVPLIIHASRALDHTENIPWLTSHIDVVPTILDLLGASDGRESEQGTPIFNLALKDRTTFFFAKPMYGADGYTAHDEFFMWHYFSDTVYKKSRAEFDPDDIVPRRSEIGTAVPKDISTMVALERAWHQRFSQGTRQLQKSSDVPLQVR